MGTLKLTMKFTLTSNFWTIFFLLFFGIQNSATFQWDKIMNIFRQYNFNMTKDAVPNLQDPNIRDMFGKIQGILREDKDLWSWMQTKAQEFKEKDLSPMDAGMELWRDYLAFMKQSGKKDSTGASTQPGTSTQDTTNTNANQQATPPGGISSNLFYMHHRGQLNPDGSQKYGTQFHTYSGGKEASHEKTVTVPPFTSGNQRTESTDAAANASDSDPGSKEHQVHTQASSGQPGGSQPGYQNYGPAEGVQPQASTSYHPYGGQTPGSTGYQPYAAPPQGPTGYQPYGSQPPGSTGFQSYSPPGGGQAYQPTGYQNYGPTGGYQTQSSTGYQNQGPTSGYPPYGPAGVYPPYSPYQPYGPPPGGYQPQSSTAKQSYGPAGSGVPPMSSGYTGPGYQNERTNYQNTYPGPNTGQSNWPPSGQKHGPSGYNGEGYHQQGSGNKKPDDFNFQSQPNNKSYSGYQQGPDYRRGGFYTHYDDVKHFNLTDNTDNLVYIPNTQNEQDNNLITTSGTNFTQVPTSQPETSEPFVSRVWNFVKSVLFPF